ncbi:hypothetical protein C1Y41_09440 [Pantoea sp. ICBG 1758]|uniref:hypothetical protein n=1 Tax=Pantoea sp. ICBG 1758 TaxID=2071682 RepID=UPI000CE30447|nr:hypothetical protein [Pantoea sp. ICBG 1758]PPC64811.1 hypothetical protein C1Y41_09440 [Pantoea sp. ICBG 1758]
MSTPEKSGTLAAFEQARTAHLEKMKEYNAICDDITRCTKEREAAIEAGKEAETNWRMRFRSLRGNLTDELKAEHSQRIASRELADEFTGLIDELELDKQFAMIGSCNTGLSYIDSHRAAFNEFADATWQSALRNVSPSLLWAIRLRLQREKVNPRDDDERSDVQVVAELIGNALTRAAAALPEKMLTEAPVLENIGLWRPALTGVDMKLYRSPLSRQILIKALHEKRARLKGGNAK